MKNSTDCGAVVAQWWRSGGAVVAQWWRSGGAVVAQWWRSGGAVVAQWWRSGESTRLPPMWPGFDSRSRRHMWVEFVVGSLLAPRPGAFLRVLRYFLLLENQHCQIPIRSGMHGHMLNELLSAL